MKANSELEPTVLKLDDNRLSKAFVKPASGKRHLIKGAYVLRREVPRSGEGQK